LYALCLLLNYYYSNCYPNATVEEALDKYFLSLWLSEYHREEIVRYVKQTVNPQNFSEIKSDCLSNVEYDLKQSCFVVDGIFRKYPDVDKNRLYPIIMSGYWSPSVLPHWVDFCLENDISF
ncbi:MAG: hypothetical protein N2558_05330, partial [Patescibacteria group bacterium]|nr:hypothetical protein [Patescibacteria group bacterium]